MGDKSILKTVFESTATQDLSSAALDVTTSIAFDTQLSMVTIKASVNITETVTISIDQNAGANFDVILASEKFKNQQDMVYIPDGDVYLKKGTEIRVQCTNANTTGTVYVVVTQVQA